MENISLDLQQTTRFVSRNISVFSRPENCPSVRDIVLISGGRLFHANGPAPWRQSVINLGERPGHLSPSFSPPFFPSLSRTPHGSWAEPAHPLPNILMQFVQSNSLIKSTLVFNVGYYRNQRACRVQQPSADLILWITGHV